MEFTPLFYYIRILSSGLSFFKRTVWEQQQETLDVYHILIRFIVESQQYEDKIETERNKFLL